MDLTGQVEPVQHHGSAYARAAECPSMLEVLGELGEPPRVGHVPFAALVGGEEGEDRYHQGAFVNDTDRGVQFLLANLMLRGKARQHLLIPDDLDVHIPAETQYDPTSHGITCFAWPWPGRRIRTGGSCAPRPSSWHRCSGAGSRSVRAPSRPAAPNAFPGSRRP